MSDLFAAPFLGGPLRQVVTAVGLYVILGVAGFLDLAAAALLTVGAYACYYAYSVYGVPFAVALGITMLFSAGCAASLDYYIYRRLRSRGATPGALLLASLGVYVSATGLIALAAGTETRALHLEYPWPVVSIMGIPFVPDDTLALLCCFVFLTIAASLGRTIRGLSTRALADDPTLAFSIGLPCQRLRTASYALGGAVVGLAGVMIAEDKDITPTMGLLGILVPAVVVVATRSSGLLAASGVVLVVGLVQQVAMYSFGAQWSDAITFCALVALLLVRAPKWQVRGGS